MKLTPSAAAAIHSESVLGTVVLLLIESGRQVEEMTGELRSAVSALDIDNPEQTRQLIIEASGRLRSVKLLLEKIDGWALNDPVGFVAEQASWVRDLCAAADAEFELAARAFAAARVKTGSAQARMFAHCHVTLVADRDAKSS
jgi:hypothetical protein